jgi:hypothetical protein
MILPSVHPDSAELIAARADGEVLTRRTSRDGTALDQHATDLWDFFHLAVNERTKTEDNSLAALIFSWLAGRGAGTTRLDPHHWGSAAELRTRLAALLRDETLFSERIVML